MSYILTTPWSSLRLSQTRAAQERMEELRQVIQLRHGEQPPQGHSRARSMTVTQRDPPVAIRQEVLEQLASDADRELMRALAGQESLQKEFRQVASEFKEVSNHVLSRAAQLDIRR
jgi:hypothetical protein